jgi:(p)ppGpp synthase/HD superfamily hydrolase
MPTLTKAIEIATQAHQGQVDKAGKPYIFHPLAVMGLVEGEADKIVAVLHDVVEDTPITLADLTAEGFSPGCVAAVDAITKRDGEPLDDYLEQVKSDPIAIRVKLADLTRNMDLSRIAEPTAKDFARIERYKEIYQILQAISGKVATSRPDG